MQVLQGLRTARVSGGDGCPLAETFHEFEIDTLAEALDIDGVDEEFIAGSGEGLQGGLGDAEIGELLPAIGDDEVFAIAHAAAEVEDEAGLADDLNEFGEAGFIETAFAKDPRGDDDV